MTLWLAQLVCLGLVVLDILARAWRIQLLVNGTSEHLGFGDAVAVNVIGDGASVATPMRLGGEPARFGVLLTSGVSLTGTLVASGYEALITWPLLIAAGAVLGLAFGAAWWTEAGPRLVSAVLMWWPWAIGIVLLSALTWVVVTRWRPWAGRDRWARPLEQAMGRWRGMPWARVAQSVPLTLVSIFARTAILPVLALSIPDPPAMGPVIVGSFALLFSQLILPTPAGAGAVEFGFLAGAAGSLGTDQFLVLSLWRFYTAGVGLLVGAWLVARRYGWAAVKGLLAARTPIDRPAERGPTD